MDWRLSWTLVSALAAANCGGGGADAGVSPFSTSAPAPSFTPSPAPGPVPAPGDSPEGLWRGSTSSGFTFDLLVLEDLRTWGVYSAAGQAQALVQGNLTVDAQTFSGTAREFDFSSSAVTDVTLAGTFTPQSSITGSIVRAEEVTFTAFFDPRYDVPASLFDLSGTWDATSVTATGPMTTTLTFNAQGGITGSNPFCTILGTATPRPSGRNVFNLALTFGGSTCAFDGQTLVGIASLLTSGGTRDLTVAALLPDRSSAFVATARRP